MTAYYLLTTTVADQRKHHIYVASTTSCVSKTNMILLVLLWWWLFFVQGDLTHVRQIVRQGERHEASLFALLLEGHPPSVAEARRAFPRHFGPKRLISYIGGDCIIRRHWSTR